MLSAMTTCSSGLPDELLQRLPRQCRHGGPTVRCAALGPHSHTRACQGKKGPNRGENEDKLDSPRDVEWTFEPS